MKNKRHFWIVVLLLAWEVPAVYAASVRVDSFTNATADAVWVRIGETEFGGLITLFAVGPGGVAGINVPKNLTSYHVTVQNMTTGEEMGLPIGSVSAGNRRNVSYYYLVPESEYILEGLQGPANESVERVGLWLVFAAGGLFAALFLMVLRR